VNVFVFRVVAFCHGDDSLFAADGFRARELGFSESCSSRKCLKLCLFDAIEAELLSKYRWSDSKVSVALCSEKPPFCYGLR